MYARRLCCMVGRATCARGHLHAPRRPLGPVIAVPMRHSTVGMAPSRRKKLSDLQDMCEKGQKITMLTAYDFVTAQAMDDAVDIVLVGDSLAMVVLGHESTVTATMDDMVRHCSAVAAGCKHAYLVCDMPFGSFATVEQAVLSAHRLVKEGGASAVKLEGGRTQVAKISAIVREGIPVMAHVGLTPQTSPLRDGYRVQGGRAAAAMQIVRDALAVQQAGAFAVVLEKIPTQVAYFISRVLSIPTIGIGAGPGCGGQVLVSNDCVGLYPRLAPKFARKYADLFPQLQEAFRSYAADVRERKFPASGHHYPMKAGELEEFARCTQEAVLTLPADASLPGDPAKFASASRMLLSEAQAMDAASKPLFPGRQPKVAVVGSGAIASVMADRLAGVAGVHMFTRDAASAAHIQQHGIQCIRSDASQSTGRVQVHDLNTWPLFRHAASALMGGSTEGLPTGSHALDGSLHSFDLVLLANKATGGLSALTAGALLASTARDTGFIVPLYNGGYTWECFQHVYADMARRPQHYPDPLRVGRADKLLYGTTHLSATRDGAVVRETHAGELLVCDPDGRLAAAPSDLMNTLAAGGLRLAVASDPTVTRLSKILVNGILNPLMALVGQPNGGFNRYSSRYADLVNGLAHEMSLLVAPHVAELRSLPGLQNFDGSSHAILQRVSQVAHATASNVNSYLMDARAGRVSEVAFINGWVAHMLEGQSVPSRYHRRVVDVLGARHDLLDAGLVQADETPLIVAAARAFEHERM